jgi:dTMP kinase
MSLFITFEGGEGSGKSFQAKTLYRRLLKMDVPAILTHEPGGTLFGGRLGHWLKWSLQEEISPLVELMMFNASRAQLVASVINPALGRGEVVVCDRYTDSTMAYQGYGRGLDLATVQQINEIATSGLNPGLTILLDIPPEIGLARKQDRKHDRFEQEKLVFHNKVRQGYLTLAEADPGRWLVLDGARTRADLSRLIWQEVARLLGAGD